MSHIDREDQRKPLQDQHVHVGVHLEPVSVIVLQQSVGIGSFCDLFLQALFILEQLP